MVADGPMHTSPKSELRVAWRSTSCMLIGGSSFLLEDNWKAGTFKWQNGVARGFKYKCSRYTTVSEQVQFNEDFIVLQGTLEIKVMFCPSHSNPQHFSAGYRSLSGSHLFIVLTAEDRWNFLFHSSVAISCCLNTNPMYY